MENFWAGFVKAAEENPEGHHVRRFLLGNPISSAIEAEPGKKLKSFGSAVGHQTLTGLGGLAAGGAAGAGLGAGAGALLGKNVGHTALLGALLGGQLGGLGGSFYGQHGAKASEIHGRHSKNKKKD